MENIILGNMCINGNFNILCMIKLEIISDARCKHCKFARKGTLMKKDGTYSSKTTTSCMNEKSKKFNQIISMRDLACDYLEL